MVRINVTNLLHKFRENYKTNAFSRFYLKLKVKQIVPTTSGKWPSALGNVVAIDSSFGREYFVQNIKNFIDDIFKE